MARVDFYVLASSGEQSRRQFACRLAEKAYRLDNSVHILARDRHSAEQIDELLWTWREGSFVPHEIVPGSSSMPAPVTIAFDETSGATGDLLINLADSVPGTAAAFPRIAEIVSSDDDQRRRSRQRFALYREQGHTLQTHKL
jgi:DNA polymerase-3 subunit chi